jgi:DeoR/GlpR family transcriptional regulator of sugar metabolism
MTGPLAAALRPKEAKAPGPRPRPRLPSRARHARIVEMLRAMGAVSVAQAAADLGVSDMTLRRDLMELETEGVLTRVHGGAVASATLKHPASEEPSFEARMLEQREAKLRIAGEAASRVAGCRALAIDVGTTAFMVAQAMRPSADMRVFTSSLRVAVELAAARVEVYLAGGRVRGGELAVGGRAALMQFGALWFDAAIIGASGLTTEGLFDYSIEDTELKRIYIERSTLKIAVCDSSKVERQSLVNICGLDEISMLITDAPPPDALARALVEANVSVVLA